MKVMIGTPSYDGNFCSQYVIALAATMGELASQGISATMALACGNPFVDLARNDIVAQFLASDCTDLLFIDADVGWDAAAVTRVLSHKQLVVVGLVPKRNKDKEDEFHANAITGVIEDGLFQSFEVPTAFMRIKREAFQILLEEHPDLKMQKDAGRKPLFFHSGRSFEDWGEDIAFCRRWVAAGQYLWIDSDITFTHYGHKTWRGNFYEHALKSGLLLKQEGTCPVQQTAP
jgi:hypothetical protein